MAIRLNFAQAEQGALFARSKMWGCPDLPDTLAYPEAEYEEDGMVYANPLTFVCQIRCEDIAALDAEGRLPHVGMLYFFAEVDYFLGHHDYGSPGMGAWAKDEFRVLYSPTCEDLHTHRVVDGEGNVCGLPAEAIVFSECHDKEDGFKLLGRPYYEEIEELYPGWLALFQMDCDDAWNLQFYDCGMLCFMIDAADLQVLQFERAECYLHSL